MRLLRLAVVVAALAFVPLAAATAVERASVGAEGEARGWPRSLYVVFTSPPEYERDFVGRFGDQGAWKGPRYTATGSASLGGVSTLDWGHTVRRGGTAEAAIAATLVHGWQRVAAGQEAVERRVGGRPAGSLTGQWVLTQGSVLAGEARYEAVLAVDLCGIWALASLSTLLPSGDSAGGAMGFGDYRMESGDRPTAWNRRKVEETLAALALEGSLPAARVAARAAGRVVAGTVSDCKRAPVAGTALVVERRVRGRWLRVRSGRTDAAGAFRLPVRTPGVHRVRAGGRTSAAFAIR
jgi:hypothetical protein